MNKIFGFLLVSGLFLSGLSGCATTYNTDNKQMSHISTPQKEAKKQSVSQNTKFPAKVDHVVVVIEENHSNAEIIGNPSAPYMNTLAKQGANFTNYHAVEHPSQPNYLDLFSGSNQGVTNDSCPHTFSTTNLASELLAVHLTFGGFSEDLPSVGYTGCSNSHLWGLGGTYARKHSPWINFTNVPASVNMPFSSFPKDFRTLPTVAFVIPNLKHDMHDGTIQQADTWLRDHLNAYVKWANTHNSLLIVTWDEDDNSQSNIVPTFMVGPMIKPGIYNGSVNHFRLLRTIEDLYGLSYAGKSAAVESVSNVWR